MNFKHLYYFWRVAKAGGVVRASEQLHLTPQTISGQIGLLEEALRTPLFAKRGRNLELTDAGRLAFGYAQDIFALGSELEESLRNYPAGGRPVEFRVGVADAVPKTIAYRLIEPARRLPESVRIVCREWKLDSLLTELAAHRLDLVIADAPIPPVGERARIQPPARRIRDKFFRVRPTPQEPQGKVPRLPGRRSDAASRAGRGSEPAPGAVVRGERAPAPRSRRIRRQRAHEGLRATRRGGVHRTDRARIRGQDAVRGEGAGSDAGNRSGILRDFRGATRYPSLCPCHHRSGERRVVCHPRSRLRSVITQGRSDQGSSPCSRPPRSPARTPSASRCTHRLPRWPGAGSSNRRRGPRRCPST